MTRKLSESISREENSNPKATSQGKKIIDMFEKMTAAVKLQEY